MKVETPQKAKKNQFQLELEAKMKDRHSRGLSTALSPSPTDFNRDSIVISDDEDDILTSLQQKSVPNQKGGKGGKLNAPHLNETMQWGDSQYWNSFLHKDDKTSDSLDIKNRKSPSWKESPRSGDPRSGDPRSGESQKGYLKSKLSPRNNLENSPRSFKEAPPSKLDIKHSSRGDYKTERKKFSYSDYVDDSPRSSGSLIDQSLSSVGDAHNTTPAASLGQRFLKSSKNVKPLSIDKEEERSIQDEVDSSRPVPRVRKKSLTSPRYAHPQELQTEENIVSVLNNDSDPQNNGRSSARIRRQASKTSASSPVPQDNLNPSSGKNSPRNLGSGKNSPRNLASGKNSPRNLSFEKNSPRNLGSGKDSPSTIEMKKNISPKDKSVSLNKGEKMKSTHSLENKRSFEIKNGKPNRNDPGSDEKNPKKERPQERSATLDKQSSQKVRTANNNETPLRTFSVESKTTEGRLEDPKPSFSRRGSLQIQNKTNENNRDKDKSRLNSGTSQLMSTPQNRSSVFDQNRSSVFDYLTEDVVEPKASKQRSQKSLENKEQFSAFATDSIDGVLDEKETSSLCGESDSESRPTPVPRRNKNLWTPNDYKGKTEKEIYEEAIKRVQDFQNAEPDKTTGSQNQTMGKPKPTCGKPSKTVGGDQHSPAALLDTTQMREEIFQEWKTQKNKVIKERKKKKILEEEKKKKELVDKKLGAVASFECWKKQKDPMLKQKLKMDKTKQDEEFEKRQKDREKKQEATKLFEIWKKEKDAQLRKEYSKRKDEEEKKTKLLSNNKVEKQKHNVSSFNTWKQTKDKVLVQKKKEELKSTTLRQKQRSYVKIQKETLSDESYQQWLWRKEEREKDELKKKRELQHLGNSYATPEPLQAWRPPSRTIPC